MTETKPSVGQFPVGGFLRISAVGSILTLLRNYARYLPGVPPAELSAVRRKAPWSVKGSALNLPVGCDLSGWELLWRRRRILLLNPFLLVRLAWLPLLALDDFEQ